MILALGWVGVSGAGLDEASPSCWAFAERIRRVVLGVAFDFEFEFARPLLRGAMVGERVQKLAFSSCSSRSERDEGKDA